MATTLNDVRAAIASADASLTADTTSVSEWVSAPVSEYDLFGLSILEDEESKLLDEARRLQAETFHAAGLPPDRIDRRNHNGCNLVTPVQNQGRCGSCVAFATCAALESRVAISREKCDPQLDLSEATYAFYDPDVVAAAALTV